MEVPQQLKEPSLTTRTEPTPKETFISADAKKAQNIIINKNFFFILFLPLEDMVLI